MKKRRTKTYLYIFLLIAIIFIGITVGNQLQLKSWKNTTEYTACGCGCCGGEEDTIQQCLYKSKGDDISEYILNDKKSAKSRACSVIGCSIGVTYKYCD